VNKINLLYFVRLTNTMVIYSFNTPCCYWESCVQSLPIFRKTPVRPLLLLGIVCSIFSFLCSILYLIVCSFNFPYGHYPSIYDFWLPLWYLVAIVLSDLFTASAYHFGILWPLYYLSFYLRLLITTLVSCGHFFSCPSISGFWLPLCTMATRYQSGNQKP
jgi:hypothetical protein